MKSVKALAITIFLSLLLGGFLMAYVPSGSAASAETPQNSNSQKIKPSYTRYKKTQNKVKPSYTRYKKSHNKKRKHHHHRHHH